MRAALNPSGYASRVTREAPTLRFHTMAPVCDVAHATSRTDFDLVVWNAPGLWFMHLNPVRRATWELTADEYSLLLRNCSRELRTMFPRVVLLYKLTNNVCDSNFDANWAQAAVMWTHRASEPSAQMALTAAGSRSMQRIEVSTVQPEGWTVIDPKVRLHCDCSAHTDGRHYLPLVPQFVVRVVEKASRENQ